MTFLDHYNNLSFVTLFTPSSTPPPSSAASPSSTSSTGWTIKITKKIQELKTKLENLNNLKEAKNGHLTEQDSKSLDSLPTQLTSLETVQKLAEFAEQLDTNKNDGNNIFTNLCTGLETFLGYSPASKGYDGTGIVYSDLDRLCDGVMGFLSGVLEAVKDENEVTTYDEYISEDNKKLKSVLKLVDSKIGTGRAGLVDAVGAVKGWLEGYEGVLTNNTRNLKNAYITLRDFNFLKISDALSSLKKLRGDDIATVADIIDKCITEAGNLSKDFTLAKVAYTKLDTPLRNKLRDTARRLEVEVARFVAAASNSELKAVVHLTGRELEVLQSTVNSHAKGCLHIMESKMNEEFNAKITQKVELINTELKQYIAMFYKWNKKAVNVMEKSLNKVAEIMNKIDGTAEEGGAHKNTENMKVRAAAQALQNKGTMLYGFAKETKTQLQVLVPKALEEVRSLNDGLRTDLQDVKEQIQTSIDMYIRGYVEEVQRNVKEITGEKGGKNGKGLEGIKHSVMEYAKRFKQNGVNVGTFGEIVQEWMRHILESKPVIEKLGESVNIKGVKVVTDVFKDMDAGVKKVAEVITGEIKKEVEAATKDFQVEKEGEIEHTLTAVQRVCEKFAQELDKVVEQKLSSIVKAMKLVQPLSDSGPSSKDLYLRNAARLTLYQLVGAARQVGLELYSLTENEEVNYNLGSNVDGALKVARVLESGFTTALAKKIGVGEDLYGTAAAFNFDDASSSSRTVRITDNIQKTITAVLDKRIGNSDGRAKIKLSELFAQYRKRISVVVDSITIDQLKGINKEGQLPEAIGKIRDEINKPHMLGNVDMGETTPYDSGVGVGDKLYGDTFKNLLATFTDDFGAFITAVKNLIKKDGDNTGGVIPHHVTLHYHLNQLKTMLNGDVTKYSDVSENLTEIKLRIHHLQNTVLTELLTNADNFYNEIMQKLADEARKSIETFVTQEIQRSIRMIREKAQTDYHKKISSLFHETKSRVTNYIIEMETMIDKDLQSGVKGLIKDLSKHLENYLINKVISGNKISDVYKNVGAFSTKLHLFLSALLSYTKSDLKKIDPKFTQLDKFAKPLEMPFAILADVGHFTSAFANTLSTLSYSTSALDPQALPDAGRPVLRALQQGMMGFVGELGKGYISRYSMETFKEGLTDTKDTLTEYGRKCAKVCLSIVPTLTDLMTINEKCMPASSYNKKVFEMDKPRPVAKYLEDFGYAIPSSSATADGELRCDITGIIIGTLLTDNKNSDNSNKLFKFLGKRDGIIEKLYGYLHRYYDVCHLRHIETPKSPTSVYQMLMWLTGLSYNRVYSDISANGFIDLFEKPEKAATDDTGGDGIIVDLSDGSEGGEITVKKAHESLRAYPESITVSQLSSTLHHVCVYAESVLIGILGYGHSDGIYAVDFNTNPHGLSYPSSASKCLDMVVEISQRLYHQLSFLLVQCSRSYDSVSWRNCWYGKEIGGSNWKCNTIQCANQDAGQKHNQRCDQKCDQDTTCGLKSPLQSFLEDGLPGFLPHPYTKADCKMKCEAPNHFGVPCKTPMGFKDIEIVASHRKTGEYLISILRDFCGDSEKPLSKLCGQLNCLLQRPPQTLGDMFAFYYNFIAGWTHSGTEHRHHAFVNAITSTNLGRSTGDLTVNDSLLSAHSDRNSTESISCLVSCANSSTSSATCGRYLQPLGLNTWAYYSKDHADRYVSWMVYITETFYDLLKKLYDECCKNCNKPGTRCHDNSCVKNCPRLRKSQLTDAKHDEKCNSIATCPFTRPTLCKYGFVLKSSSNMSGAEDASTKRTCQDFCKLLKTILNDEKSDKDTFAKLVYETIPYFLYQIRFPFMSLTLALWLLSLLYLLHIMVIRLDLLHIKSHLHSPSSHRIAAQSLLAAARVNKLNRVFYLQP